MNERPIDLVLSRLGQYKSAGDGRDQFAARCPVRCGDAPSLAVAVGSEEQVLLRCFAGCDSEAILAALGLTWHDLFPDDRPSVGGEAVT